MPVRARGSIVGRARGAGIEANRKNGPQMQKVPKRARVFAKTRSERRSRGTVLDADQRFAARRTI